MANRRTTNASQLTLSEDERLLLNIYLQLETNTNRQIERLYDILDQIRSSMSTLIETIGDRNDFRLNNQRRENLQNTNLNYTYRNNSRNERNTRNANTTTNTNNNNNRTSNRRSDPPQSNADFQHNNAFIYIGGVPYRIEFDNNFIPYNRITRNNNRPINLYPNNNANNNTNNNTNRIFQNIFTRIYDDVIVRPTTHQINNATENVVFSQITNPINNNCPITLERFSSEDQVTRIRHCGHIFNPQSLISWFGNNVRCPVCRYDIRDHASNDNSQQNDNLDELEEEPEEEEVASQEMNQNQTSYTNDERNSNSNNQNAISDLSNNEILNSLQSITQEVINSVFSGGDNVNLMNNRSYYDPSRNEYVFQGYFVNR
jgi:hypothetical protein